MDFKNFCKDESKQVSFLKEYKGILEKVIKIQQEPKYYTHRRHEESIQKRSFYGDPDEIIKDGFEKFKGPIYDTYEPYEETSGVFTFCDKCDGRPSKEFLGDNLSKIKRKPPQKKTIPEHLMGRFIRQKSSSESDESDDEVEPKMLYKIIIQTNESQGSGTSAPVSIRLIGSTTKSEPINLSKKCGSLKFAFAPGSKEVFHVKSIVAPVLKGVNIKLEANNSNDEWLGDYLSIEELSGDRRKWFCKIDRWLSSRREKCELFAKLKPEAYKVPVIVYTIKVCSSNESVDEFCGQLSLQLFGLDRKSDIQELIANDRQKTIKRGSTATFAIKCDEVGQLKAIRLAVEDSSKAHKTEQKNDLKSKKFNQEEKSDNKKKSPLSSDDKRKGFSQEDKIDNKRKSPLPAEEKRKGWNDIKIDKISILWNGSDKKDYEIEFSMNDWIGLSHKMTKKSIILKEPIDIKKQLKKASKASNQDISTYDVTFYTGKNTFSGTDATVYLIFHGSHGKSKTYDFVDFNKKSFESGKEDAFRISGPGVGSIEKVEISHNNKGIASGWKLEKVTVVRHLTAMEICMSLEELKRTSSLPKEIIVEDGKVIKIDEVTALTNSLPTVKEQVDKKTVIKNRFQEAEDDDINSYSSSEFDSDEEIVVSAKANKKKKNMVVNKSKQDDNEHKDLLRMKLPYAEESSFVCHKWIIEKGHTKLKSITIDAERKNLLYSPISLLLNPDD